MGGVGREWIFQDIRHKGKGSHTFWPGLYHRPSRGPKDHIVVIDICTLRSCVPGEERTNVLLGNLQVTFSGLLNTLDGVASSEERLVFMTTNYLERLDPALIRPGRVDLKQKIDLASRSQLVRMYARFYPEHASTLAGEFADKVMGLGQSKSIAQIQGHFMSYKSDAVGSVDNIEQLSNL